MTATVTFPAVAEPDAGPERVEPRPVEARPVALPRRTTRSKLWTLAIAVPVVAVVVLVSAHGALRFPAFADDEGTYTAQAWALLSRHTLSHYTYWYDHPPLGWAQLALGGWILAPLLRIVAPAADAVGRARLLMLGFTGVTAALVFVWARRLGLRRSSSAVATLAFGLSPLSVGLLRQVYLDGMALPWVVGAFVLAATPTRRLWAFAASGACFAAAVLTKETNLLLLPALGLAVWQRCDRRTRSFCLTAFISPLVLLLLGYPLMALLKGELFPGSGHVSLFASLHWQLWGRASTGSALTAGSAARHLVSGWLHTDPWLLGTGVLTAPVAVMVPRLRAPALALIILVLATLRPGYLPQMFVVTLLPFCAVVAAGLADEAVTRARAAGIAVAAIPVGAAVILMAIVGLAWRGPDRASMTTNATAPDLAAERWVAHNVDARARVLVDDTFYVDMVEAGFRPQLGVVWFYKLDFTDNLDPSVERALPRGYKAFDYVVSTPVIRTALADNPGFLQQVRLALAASHPVATFGSGADVVEVRRLTGAGVGSGALPRPPATGATGG
jgi:hypothetical protein